MGFKGQTRGAVGLAAFTLMGLVSLAPPVTMLTSAGGVVTRRTQACLCLAA